MSTEFEDLPSPVDIDDAYISAILEESTTAEQLPTIVENLVTADDATADKIFDGVLNDLSPALVAANAAEPKDGQPNLSLLMPPPSNDRHPNVSFSDYNGAQMLLKEHDGLLAAPAALGHDDDDDNPSSMYSSATKKDSNSRWEQLLFALKPMFTRDRGDGKASRRATLDTAHLSRRLSSVDVNAVTAISHDITPASPASPTSPMSTHSLMHPSPIQMPIEGLMSPAHRRQRSSLDIPRTPPHRYTEQQQRGKDRLRDTIERIRNVSLPKTLFRKKDKAEQPLASPTSDAVNFSALVVVPFYATVRDEHGRKRPPFLLDMVSLKVVDGGALDADNSMFCIELKYGEMSWTIRRSLVEMLRLHSSMTLRNLHHKTGTVPKFPSQLHYAIAKARVAALPNRDAFARICMLVRLRAERKKAIERYLMGVLHSSKIGVNHDVFSFFELGPCIRAGSKGKEGFLKRQKKHRFRVFGRKRIYRKHRTVWFSVHDSFVVQYDSIACPYPRDVILFDQSSNVTTHRAFRKRKFEISTQFRSLVMKTESERQREEFIVDINTSIENSIWCQPHRFNSFAPIRSGINAKYYIDGADYFADVYDAIRSAKDTIYIQDWWLSPEVFLLRPPAQHPQSRIDVLLKQKAEEGVMIYIILYKELAYALPIASAHTKFSLVELHRNIRVMRFPDHLTGVLYWALHDKILVVDEKRAFCGGLDLCMGRYDTKQHLVGDIGNVETWPGIDYSNPRIKDFQDVHEPTNELVDKNMTARMPWHDVHCGFDGEASRDIARHFVIRWNHIKHSKSKDREDIPYLLPPAIQNSSLESAGTCDIQVLRSASQWSSGVETETSIYDAYIELIRTAEHFIYIENQFFISSAGHEDDTGPVLNRIAQAITDRIIRANTEGKKFRVFIITPLLPAFQNDLSELNAATVRLIVHWHQRTIAKGDFSMFAILKAHGIENPFDYISICSLRAHGALPRTREGIDPIVTEQVYIHSKIIIVDDLRCIIGSANINDRSMLGSRDGEVAVLIEDRTEVESVMDGDPFTASKFAYDLRMSLFKEHLGLGDDVPHIDPLDDIFYEEVWQFTAAFNTSTYRDVFMAIPDNTVQTWDDYSRFTSGTSNIGTGHVASRSPRPIYLEQLSQVRGNLVHYPLNFLAKESLDYIFPAPESLVSVDVFI
eukprot:Partr_v1_DN28401_c3_g1_i1_m42306 putative Phospholipase